MEDNITIEELENKKQKKEYLKILEKLECKNYYLLEGLERENINYSFLTIKLQKRKTEFLALIKYSKYLYIQKLTDNEGDIPLVLKALLSRYPHIQTIFGDYQTLSSKDIFSSGPKIKKKIDYIFMRLQKDNFKPILTGTRGIRVFFNYENAISITPLLISYEVEELNIRPEKINPDIVTKIISLRLQKGELTVLTYRGVPVGISGINARYKNTCQIGSVYVKEEYRKKGYGAYMLSMHLKRLFHKYENVVLFVRTDNTGAINLYRKLGFKNDGRLVQYILNNHMIL